MNLLPQSLVMTCSRQPAIQARSLARTLHPVLLFILHIQSTVNPFHCPYWNYLFPFSHSFCQSYHYLLPASLHACLHLTRKEFWMPAIPCHSPHLKPCVNYSSLGKIQTSQRILKLLLHLALSYHLCSLISLHSYIFFALTSKKPPPSHLKKYIHKWLHLSSSCVPGAMRISKLYQSLPSKNFPSWERRAQLCLEYKVKCDQ